MCNEISFRNYARIAESAAWYCSSPLTYACNNFWKCLYDNRLSAEIKVLIDQISGLSMIGVYHVDNKSTIRLLRTT